MAALSFDSNVHGREKGACMHRMAMIAVAATAALAGGCAAAEPVKLFNGENLDGWIGDPKFWSVVDGVVVGQTPGIDYNTFLYSEKEYSDFVLTLKVRLSNHNSGVQFRSKVVDEDKYVMAGYQGDLAPQYWGLLYEERGRGMLDFRMDTRKIAKTGEWVDMKIEAKGPRIVITTNGVKTVEYTETDPEKGAKKGRFGLQLHGGPPMKVEFKDMVIEEG